jgi:hypothetical protein
LILLIALSACLRDPSGPGITSIELRNDRIQFDALGDTLSFDATARNLGGSVLIGDSLAYSVGDPSVVALQPETRMVSVGQGQTVLTVRDPESGVIGEAVIVVDQVATTLLVKVDSGKPIVALPEGALLPLECQAYDRNGFEILHDAVLVTSIRGTVTSGGCGDARIQRSGYDTLVFALGQAQVRVPVIVATGPDSIGIVAAAQPLTVVERNRFVGEDLASPFILSLRPLVNDILAAYGNPTSNLGRARAIRDWVARTAVSPDPAVHPDNSTSNLSVLPPGTTWADVNRVLSPAEWDNDRTYWDGQYYEGYAMLDRLLGTLDRSTGTRADDGMMVHVAGAHYRIRDIRSYHYTLCTFQAIIATAMWKAAGLQGMVITTLDHDPAAVFIPELGRWVYEDPTFSEEYLLDGAGDPLSPVDLLTLSTNGQAARLTPTKLSGPSFDPEPYITARSYMNVHPEGMVVMGSQIYDLAVGRFGGWGGRFVQIDVPRLATAPAPLNDPLLWARVTAMEAFPTLGVVVQELRAEDSVYVVRLSSTHPYHEHFERRLDSAAWQPVTALDVLPVGACRVEYRSVDAIGNISASAVLEVWAPRVGGFLEAGAEGGTRRRAQSCS